MMTTENISATLNFCSGQKWLMLLEHSVTDSYHFAFYIRPVSYACTAHGKINIVLKPDTAVHRDS
jgi:hypothetical protein